MVHQLAGNRLVRAQNDVALNQIFKFADVASPTVSLQHRDDAGL